MITPLIISLRRISTPWETEQIPDRNRSRNQGSQAGKIAIPDASNPEPRTMVRRSTDPNRQTPCDANGLPVRAWMAYSPAQRSYIVYPPSSKKIPKQSYPVGKLGLEGAWLAASQYLDRHGLSFDKPAHVSRVRQNQYLLAGVYPYARKGSLVEGFSAQKFHAETGAYTNQRFAIGPIGFSAALRKAVTVRLACMPAPLEDPGISLDDWCYYLEWAFRKTRGLRPLGPILPAGWRRRIDGATITIVRKGAPGTPEIRFSTDQSDPWGTIALVIQALRHDRVIVPPGSPRWANPYTGRRTARRSIGVRHGVKVTPVDPGRPRLNCPEPNGSTLDSRTR